MDAPAEFFRDYDCIAICGCFRFGSTALAQKIARFLQDNQQPALFLNEFFTGHHFLTHTDEGQLIIDSLEYDWLAFGNEGRGVRTILQRPIPDNLFRSKLDWLRQSMSKTKMVLKLDPSDWQGSNGSMLEEFILDNPRVYTLGLNRQDVGNAMISYLIGTQFNFWNYPKHMIVDEYDKEVHQLPANTDDMQSFIDHMLLHNNWLWYMRDRLDKLIWYDEIEHLRIPEIGLHQDISTWADKHHVSHAERVRKYFTNPSDVLRIAADVQTNFNGIIESVRKRYAESITG